MLQDTPRKSIARYAMEYGVYFGLYLIVKFVLTTFSINNFVANFASEVLLIAIPFFLYFIMRHYKKQDGGNVRFSQLWMFGIFLFFFASLLSGVVEYVYYRYINPTYIETQMAAVLDLIEKMTQTQNSETLKMMREGLAKGGAPSPIEMVFQTIWANVFFGSLLSIIVALIVARKKKIKTL
ncbi:DUF4199 domain-containing protein [Coprobacter sp.]